MRTKLAWFLDIIIVVTLILIFFSCANDTATLKLENVGEKQLSIDLTPSSFLPILLYSEFVQNMELVQLETHEPGLITSLNFIDLNTDRFTVLDEEQTWHQFDIKGNYLSSSNVNSDDLDPDVLKKRVDYLKDKLKLFAYRVKDDGSTQTDIQVEKLYENEILIFIKFGWEQENYFVLHIKPTTKTFWTHRLHDDLYDLDSEILGITTNHLIGIVNPYLNNLNFDSTKMDLLIYRRNLPIKGILNPTIALFEIKDPFHLN